MLLFITDLLPISVTAVLGALAMVLFGVISFKDAFAGFGSESLMMVVGMLIIGETIDQSGLTERLGAGLKKLAKMGTRTFIGVGGIFSGFISAFMSDTAQVAAFLPLVRSLEKSSGGKLKSKNLSMAFATVTLLGSSMTLIGSPVPMLANSLMVETGTASLNFFTTLPGGLVLLIIGVVYYMTIGYTLTNKMDVSGARKELPEEASMGGSGEGHPKNKQKQLITLVVFIGCIFVFISGILSVGTVAILGALLLIITRCISLKQIVEGVNWTPVIVLGGSLGMSAGLTQSGAGELLASQIVGFSNAAGIGSFLVFGIVIALVVILTQFISSTATVAIVAPIGILIANAMGFSVTTMIIGIIYAAPLSLITPIGTPAIIMTLVEGYKFTDYIKVGLPLTVILMVAITFITPAIYGF